MKKDYMEKEERKETVYIIKRSKTARALRERERERERERGKLLLLRGTNERFYLDDDDDVRREELHLKESFHLFHSFIHSFIRGTKKTEREHIIQSRTQTHIKRNNNKRNMAQSALVVYLRKLLRVVNYLPLVLRPRDRRRFRGTVLRVDEGKRL